MSSLVLTPEYRAALERQPGRPLRIVDPESNREYLLMPAELIDQGGMNGEPAPDLSAAPFPKVGTPEWGRMNERRAELIRKKIRGELTEVEGREYEWLQRGSLGALDDAHPRTAVGETTE